MDNKEFCESKGCIKEKNHKGNHFPYSEPYKEFYIEDLPEIEREIKMSKITDAIKGLQSKINPSHYAKIFNILNPSQQSSIMKLIMLVKTDSPEIENKGKDFILTLSEDQKKKLSDIVGKDVVDSMSEAVR